MSGTAAVGSLLTASNGTFSGSGLTYTYQWLQDGNAIAGATNSTYTVVAADAGHDLSVQVTASNGGGTATATSSAISIPAPVVTANSTTTTATSASATGTSTGSSAVEYVRVDEHFQLPPGSGRTGARQR